MCIENIIMSNMYSPNMASPAPEIMQPSAPTPTMPKKTLSHKTILWIEIGVVVGVLLVVALLVVFYFVGILGTKYRPVRFGDTFKLRYVGADKDQSTKWYVVAPNTDTKYLLSDGGTPLEFVMTNSNKTGIVTTTDATSFNLAQGSSVGAINFANTTPTVHAYFGAFTSDAAPAARMFLFTKDTTKKETARYGMTFLLSSNGGDGAGWPLTPQADNTLTLSGKTTSLWKFEFVK
jgi:hypothetical protein